MEEPTPGNGEQDVPIPAPIPPAKQLAEVHEDAKSNAQSSEHILTSGATAMNDIAANNDESTSRETLQEDRSTPIPAGLSSATTEILARMSAQPSADYTFAREQILKSIVTSDNLPSLPPSVNGRGRGRPKGSGRKDDSRASSVLALLTDVKVEEEPASSTSNPVTATPAVKAAPARGGKRRSIGRARGGKRAGKRKRRSSDASSLTDSDAEMFKLEQNEGGDGDAAEPKITKSGRAVHRPAQFVPSQASPTTVSTTQTTTQKKKKKRIRRNPESAVCKSCERGHSPNNNAIVFCDGCATPYHQYCHTPPIDKEFIDIPEKEWLCVDCGVAPVELPSDFSKLISGEKFSDDEKRSMFSQLTHAQLIDVLVHASTLQPSLTIIPPPTVANGAYQYLEPGAELPYDGYETDPPAHYPKPGNGLARTLPPESEGLDWLLDDNTEVFSHVVNYSNKTRITANGIKAA